MQYSFGAYRFDPARYALTHAGTPVPLRPQACELLAYLLRHRDRVVPKEELLAQVWPGQYVGDGVLHACVLAVRTALHDTGRTPALLHTVRGRGYRFVAPVEVSDRPLDDPPQGRQPLRSAPAPLADVPLPSPAGSETTAAAAVAAEPHAAGEYKQVSVLCCGLAEAPSLAARLGPEGLYHRMQTMVGLAQEVLHLYAGTLLPPTSEGLMAVFGAPVAQEDHARRAVVAALALQQRLRAHPGLRAQMAGTALAVRMGVNSGLVVVGSLGQDPQRRSTVVGAPLHLALRLQQRAAPGTILLSAATYQLVQAEVRVAPCGTLAVEGGPTPMPVYTVQGLVGRHAGVVGRGRRDQSPFVGRVRELALLDDHLAAAMAGHGQVVGLVGEPGMGKTRLLAEFCRWVPGDQVTIYTGQCLSYGQSIPYLPVRDLLQQVCGLVEGDTAAVHTAAVQHRLHASGMTAEDDVALLLQLLDLPAAPEDLARRSPEGRQARTFALLRHLILDAAQQRPLVLVVENLHWSDPTSAAWLASLVERLAGAAVLLLGTYRPGYQPAWGAHAAVTQVVVPPLRAQESRTVVQAVLGAVSLPEARLRALVAQAGGNPFFLEELAWHAREQGAPDTPGAVPETVYAVLAARMDRLSSEAKHLLQVAAVVGPEVSLPLLQVTAELSEAALHRGLTQLQAAEFLYETRLLPDHAYTFKHALTHEVAYSSLLQEQRRLWHARIVEALEGLAGDRVAEQVERLAHHALRGAVWDKAVTYCQQAGARAATRSAYREAVAYFEQALTALAQLPECCDTLAQAIDLRFALRNALLVLGENERLLEHLRAAETLARTLGDQRRLGQVSAYLGAHFHATGAYDQAITAYERTIAASTTLGEVALQVQVTLMQGITYYTLGDYHRAVDCFSNNVAFLVGERSRELFGLAGFPAVFSQNHLALCLMELGAFAEGRVHAEEAIRLAEAVHQPYTLTVAYHGAGVLALRQGDLPKAIPLLERGLHLCQDGGVSRCFHALALALGVAYALCGRVAETLPLLEQAVQLSALHWPSCFSPFLWPAEAYLLVGRLEEATTVACRALDHAIIHKERGYQAQARWLLGEVARRCEPPDIDQAEAHYRQALTLAEELGMRPLQAHCHRGLGALYATTGLQEQARTALSTALDLYRTMDMTFWLPQTEAARAQVEGQWGYQPEMHIHAR